MLKRQAADLRLRAASVQIPALLCDLGNLTLNFLELPFPHLGKGDPNTCFQGS